jgi:hypothetical protein
MDYVVFIFPLVFPPMYLLAIATGPVATTSVVPGSVAICFADSDYIAILFLLLFIMFLLV